MPSLRGRRCFSTGPMSCTRMAGGPCPTRPGCGDRTIFSVLAPLHPLWHDDQCQWVASGVGTTRRCSRYLALSPVTSSCKFSLFAIPSYNLPRRHFFTLPRHSRTRPSLACRFERVRAARWQVHQAIQSVSSFMVEDLIVAFKAVGDVVMCL